MLSITLLNRICFKGVIFVSIYYHKISYNYQLNKKMATNNSLPLVMILFGIICKQCFGTGNL